MGFSFEVLARVPFFGGFFGYLFFELLFSFLSLLGIPLSTTLHISLVFICIFCVVSLKLFGVNLRTPLMWPIRGLLRSGSFSGES